MTDSKTLWAMFNSLC